MPGVITAGTRRDPWLERTSTRSPCATPRRCAVLGLISIQLLHVADARGPGSPCGRGRCGSEPSRNAADGYGRKWKGYWLGSPSNCAALAAIGSVRGGPAVFGSGPPPHHPPCFCAVLHAS